MSDFTTETRQIALELSLKSFISDNNINTRTNDILERAEKFHDFILASQAKILHKDIDEKE